MNDIITHLKEFALASAPKLLTALVVLVIGLTVTKIVMHIVTTALSRSRLDKSLHVFLKSLVKIGLIFLVLIITAGTLGINTASLVAVLGAAGLALSLALKDSLANLASGLLILVSHPFRVDDFIETGSESGTVKEIGLIYTRLNTPDNKQIYLPNSQVTTAQIINFSAEELRRLDLVFSVGYQADIDAAKAAIAQVLEDNPYALSDPAPLIRVCAHSPSSIDIATRVWVKTEHYWDLNFDLFEQVKSAFDAQGIEIPYQKIDVQVASNS